MTRENRCGNCIVAIHQCDLCQTRQALAAANALIGEAADEAKRLQDQIDSLEGALDIAMKRHDLQLKEAHRNGLEQAARHVENHCCVSSCCDAQPSAGEAKALAKCIREIQVLILREDEK